MTTQEQNKLIAEFMGYEVVRIGYYGCHDDYEWDETEWQVTNRVWLDKMCVDLIGDYIVQVAKNKIHAWEDVKYDSDWSQLMPVWFKCRHLGADMGYVFKKFYEEFHAGIDLQSITKSYRACLDFIQWYNQQNTSKHATE